MNKIFITFFCTMNFFTAIAMQESAPQLLQWEDLKTGKKHCKLDDHYIERANSFISAYNNGNDLYAKTIGDALLKEVACSDEYIVITQMLLAHGIDADASYWQSEENGSIIVPGKLHPSGITNNPLYNSSRYAPKTLKVLLEAGANPNVKIEGDHLFSPVHNILRSSYWIFWTQKSVEQKAAMLTHLLQHGASLNLTDVNNRTALQMVCQHNPIRDMPGYSLALLPEDAHRPANYRPNYSVKEYFTNFLANSCK